MTSLSLTAVHLRVADLSRSVDFYTRGLGFVVVNLTPERADLAVAPAASAILTLTGDPSAPPAAPDAAGLFHAALLFPSAPALGAWLKHAAQAGVEFDGFSDHGVSEAVYFTDPDGNGLEFYTDRPATAWPRTAAGELAMTTERLNVPALLAAASPATATPLAGARWGHLHLRVTNLDRSDAYYRKTLGLALTQGSYPGARFLAADGYHHHLGLNTWGHPRTPRPSAALGLVEATFAHAGLDTAQQLTDPDGIALRLIPEPHA
ncbi:MAG: VOC family protein [Verrucomicrobia bacterium]|nr:VOC family protein [Verrucomicrobiota bacterium]